MAPYLQHIWRQIFSIHLCIPALKMTVFDWFIARRRRSEELGNEEEASM